MCNEHRGNLTALVQSFISASSCGPFTAPHFFRALFLTSQFPKPTALTMQRLLLLIDVCVQCLGCRQSKQDNNF